MALSDIAARNAKPGKKMYKLTDEYGLYLQVNPAGIRWCQRHDDVCKWCLIKAEGGLCSGVTFTA